nr:protein piccolo-like [Manis javanica]
MHSPEPSEPCIPARKPPLPPSCWGIHQEAEVNLDHLKPPGRVTASPTRVQANQHAEPPVVASVTGPGMSSCPDLQTPRLSPGEGSPARPPRLSLSVVTVMAPGLVPPPWAVSPLAWAASWRPCMQTCRLPGPSKADPTWAARPLCARTPAKQPCALVAQQRETGSPETPKRLIKRKQEARALQGR